jgi:glutamate racemase
MLPREDMIYLAERRNCPYGTKTKEELTRLVRADLKRLRELGATDILAACCTASTVCPLLGAEETAGVLTLIAPTADFIAKNENRENRPIRVLVIATKHTATSKAFSTEITAALPRAKVTEWATQELVSFVEEGSSDGNLKVEAEKYLEDLCRRALDASPNYLVLGCTHFSHLKAEIGKRLPGIVTVNPAGLGALYLAKRIKEKRKASGQAKDLYIE